MVWGASFRSGVCPLSVVHGRRDSKKYIEVTEQVMLPFVNDNMPNALTLQQGNALMHGCKETN